MRTSIRLRILVAMNLLVVGVGLAAGWVGIEVTARTIEQQLVDDPVRNASLLMARMRLPASEGLMKQLAEILDAQFVAGPGEPAGLDRPIVASSLPLPQTTALANMLAGEELPAAAALEAGGRPPGIELGERRYRIRSTPAARTPNSADEPVRLYILVDEAKLTAAKQRSFWTIAAVTATAIVAATVLATLIATTISGPVRRLADRMDRVARDGSPDGSSQKRGHELFLTGAKIARDPFFAPEPAEIVRLTASFEHLLARLAEANEQLARQARLAALGEVAASVAHELRNPLSGIKMNARVLADELERRNLADESLELIIREIDRTELYLKELLDVACAEGDSNRPEDEPTRVDLTELADSALRLVEGRCRHQGVAIEKNWPEAGLVVVARGDAIRQVMLNLMLNAIDAMSGGGTMRLSGRAAGAAGAAARFEVSDTGAGVSADEGVDIFEPFVTTKPRGTGLGLHVCRQIITRHGGRLGYHSAAGGSTFWFELGVTRQDSGE